MWGLATARRAVERAVGLLHASAAPPRLVTQVQLKAVAGLCSKAPGEKAASETNEAAYSFKVPGHKPTGWEKKILLWGGRFKKESDIPEIVSFEMVDSAKTKVRVKFAIIMMLLTIVGCITMVTSGKRAVARHESLAGMNLERKARLHEEPQQDVVKAE